MTLPILKFVSLVFNSSVAEKIVWTPNVSVLFLTSLDVGVHWYFPMPLCLGIVCSRDWTLKHIWIKGVMTIFIFYFFLASDYCRFCVVIRFFHPRHNAQWRPTSKNFPTQILSMTFIFWSSFLRNSQYFPFQCRVLNKGTTGTLFITSLVWRGPWLGIEPGTSRTRSQHSTTRLSRRWLWVVMLFVCVKWSEMKCFSFK